MSNSKMLIDATHPEETRVVVIRNGRVEEFDYESASRKLLRGNIYLAKVTRVEPSLQAAFVEYGGNRHGFLAFNEIHPDYYQIPMADRQALIDEEAAEEARAEAEADARAERMARGRGGGGHRRGRGDGPRSRDGGDGRDEDVSGGEQSGEAMAEATGAGDDVISEVPETTEEIETFGGEESGDDSRSERADDDSRDVPTEPATDPRGDQNESGDGAPSETAEASADAGEADRNGNGGADEAAGTDAGESAGAAAEAEAVEQTGSEDALEELPSRPRRHRRSYKIQEVIKRRQVILVQVVKEERGTKGAALTTYLSLAGRYTVLMPNTARGGGISRKITNPADRKRLKAIANELEVPEGMGLIIRTAGATRTKQEIKRDFEYLLRLWESVRELTLGSSAPSLVYEEGNLIKRSIRDLYNKDVEEIVVAGEHAHTEAKDFMRMLMPSHTKHVLAHADKEPLFTRYGIERQLNAMFSPYVTLKSGGYLVINQTEALVAIDINSGKSTREFSIEETALNTNLEAADEIARQLKLRDLAGLIVIDFIDMEEKRNNRAVERRIKDALRFDRARIQIGHISHFGLLEMSRQRMRTGVLEGSTSQCPHCQGTGIIRSTESVALAVLRGLEDALMAGTRHALVATTTAPVALYILNNKRNFINDMETRHGISVTVTASDKLQGANFTIEKGHAPVQQARRPDRTAVNMDWGFEGEGGVEEIEEAPEPRDSRGEESEAREGGGRAGAGNGEGDVEGESGGRRRRRRRRGGRDRGERGDGRREHGGGEPRNGYEDQPSVIEAEDATDEAPGDSDQPDLDMDAAQPDENAGEGRQPHGGADRKDGRRRRRGRRGGRRGRGRQQDGVEGGDGYDGGPIGSSEAGAEAAASEATDDRSDQPAAAEPGEREHVEVASREKSAEEPVLEPRAHEPRARRAEAEQASPPSASPSPPRRSRDYNASSEPKIERVVVGAGTKDEHTASEPPTGPVRKGWWQRTLGG